MANIAKNNKLTNASKWLALTLIFSLMMFFSLACGNGNGNATPPAQSETQNTPESSPIATDETEVPDQAQSETTDEATRVRVALLKGPTAIGAVNMMNVVDEGAITSPNYAFKIAGSVDEIVPLIVQGEIDIAAVPANLASVLYNNTNGAVSVLAIHTLGMIYILERGDEIATIEDLRGKTIIAAGKGAPQEYALNYILSENGIDPEKDVTIEWKAEHSEVVAALTSGLDSIALLPQPFVTTALMADDELRIALDLNDEWDKVATGDESSAFILGVMIARNDFIENNREVVADFLASYERSINIANNDVEGTAALVGKYEIFPENVAKEAIPHCKIVFIDGNDMKEQFSGFLQILFEQNPMSVGGVLPNEDFYYLP